MVCNKVREGDKRIVRLKEGNPAGCHVVIVDDLVQSGGTLIECQVYSSKTCNDIDLFFNLHVLLKHRLLRSWKCFSSSVIKFESFKLLGVISWVSALGGWKQLVIIIGRDRSPKNK